MNDLARHRGRPLRVLHGVYEIAGQGMMLARGLRELGCEARALSYQTTWDGRVSDFVVDLDRATGPIDRGLKMMGAFAKWASWADVFHFHFGTTFLSRLSEQAGPEHLLGNIELPLLRSMGKRIVFHFHGCEVRNRAHMLRTHRLSTCTECDPFCRPHHQRWLLEQTARHADRAVFSTLDLAESVPGATHLPLAIESARWIAAGRAHQPSTAAPRDGVNGPVVIAHAPTDQLIKGTRHVVAAFEALRAEFPKLELRLIEKRPWAEMPEFLAGCDILVDQLLMGWYGLLAIEGMAEGKAVVAHLREDFAHVHPDLPVVNAEPATLVDVLRGLIRDPARRAALGERGREFVPRVHDTRVVGERLLRLYREILEPARGAAAVEGAR